MAVLRLKKSSNKFKKFSSLEMEICLSEFLYCRVNLIVPNVHWGMFNYELDLFLLTKSGRGTEIEIKVDKYDLIKDKLKKHKHWDHRIKYLYFAIPNYLQDHTEHIPERAGIIVVSKINGNLYAKKIRKPKKNSDYRFTEKERSKLLHLMALRIWGLKKKLGDLNGL